MTGKFIAIPTYFIIFIGIVVQSVLSMLSVLITIFCVNKHIIFCHFTYVHIFYLPM